MYIYQKYINDLFFLLFVKLIILKKQQFKCNIFYKIYNINKNILKNL